MKDLDEFTKAYIGCALWASNDESTPEGGVPFDDNYGPEDLSKETLEWMVKDCQTFQDQNLADIQHKPIFWLSLCRLAGHDFWLTRNEHGAGFWDGDWPEAAASRLTLASEQFGKCHLLLGDNGVIHHFNG